MNEIESEDWRVFDNRMQPHFRWRCECGRVGGWRARVNSAKAGLTLHRQFAHEGRVHPRKKEML